MLNVLKIILKILYNIKEGPITTGLGLIFIAAFLYNYLRVPVDMESSSWIDVVGTYMLLIIGLVFLLLKDIKNTKL